MAENENKELNQQPVSGQRNQNQPQNQNRTQEGAPRRRSMPRRPRVNAEGERAAQSPSPRAPRKPRQTTAQQPAQEGTQASVQEKPRRPRMPRRPAASAAPETAAATENANPRAPRANNRPRPARSQNAGRSVKPAAQNQQIAAAAPAEQQTAATQNPVQPRCNPPRMRTGAPRQNNAAPRAQKAASNRPAEAMRPRQGGRRRIVSPIMQEEKPCISQTLQWVGKKPPTMRSRASEHPSRATLRMIPLGGMCEIGKNMTAYEYGNDIIIVDCGQIFPDETMPGVDAVIPDFTYVLQNRDRVRGIFITHGHEDHIGGLPYLMREFRAPIYGGRMTIELLKYKLDDRVPGLTKSCELHVVEAGETVRCGCFSVEFIHVNHSIADAFMFAIRTPIGVIMHSGDFKIDYTPINGAIMDLQRIAQIGREGVLLFVCESTNIEVPGFSKSERHVGESMADMFKDAKGRIFVATFSSNVSRLQQIFTAAERHGRKVALVGRSMLNVFNAANNLGYIQKKPDTLIEISQVDNYPPEQVVIISTGSQGEPMSALTRIAFSNHREIEIQPGDTVIISATPIPGNEKPIYKVINELYRRGAKVY